MQQTTPNVNTGIAPLTNVALCLGTLKRSINRPRHLPGITVFYGPSGFGKSTAAACAVIQCRACYVQARSSWTKKAAHETICKGLGLKPGRTLSEMLDQIAEELALSGKPLVIDEAEYGYAKCSMVIEPRHCNAWAFQWEAPSLPWPTLLLLWLQPKRPGCGYPGSQITFLKSAKGKHLTAVARQIKDGKRVCFYEVVVSDELGTEVAFVTINGYVVRDQGEG